MNKTEMIALLKTWGVTVPENCTDEWLKAEVAKGKPAQAPTNATPPPPTTPAAPSNVVELQSRLTALEAQRDAERKANVTAAVNAMVGEFRVTAEEAPKAIARAIADPTYLDELRARQPNVPGNAPLNAGLVVVNEDMRNVLGGISKHVCSTPNIANAPANVAVDRSRAIASIYRRERERILPVLNGAGATNTIDAALKRALILQETVRAFATRVLPLRAFATAFLNTPLQGTDTVIVPYYPLQTAASSDFSDGDGAGGTGYNFGQASTTNGKTITVNKRKYQPLDYSSNEFRRQPWFDAVRLGSINAEKLGVDVLTDVLSVITAANYGAAGKISPVAALTSDDIADLKGVCTAANWPDAGRSLIVDSTVDTVLMKDASIKAAYALGSPEVIRDGRLTRIMGFDYYQMPSFPSNGENLVGIAAFQSAIGAAFAPIDPAPGVRAQLVAYEIATDEATGISFNYRHWGLAQADRDYEVIECAYGYAALVAAAIKRITTA